MKVLKFFFALILLSLAAINMDAQRASTGGDHLVAYDQRTCMRGSCGFTMCMQPSGQTDNAGDQCIFVQIINDAPEDLYISSDSGDFIAFNNTDYASATICYNLNDSDITEDSQITITCGTLLDYDGSPFENNPYTMCKDGCIVVVGDSGVTGP